MGPNSGSFLNRREGRGSLFRGIGVKYCRTLRALPNNAGTFLRKHPKDLFLQRKHLIHGFFLQGIESPLVMYIILTAVGVIGTVATSLLPETYGQPMLECVEDLEQIVRHPFFSFRVWKNSKGPSVEEEGTKEETNPLKKPAKFTDLTSEI